MADDKPISQYLEQTHDKIFESNKKWVESKKIADPDFFKKLAAGQSPDYL
jgi:carbonic anhydrase